MARTYPAAYYRALATLATDAQWAYVKRLVNEAFVKGYDTGTNIDPNHRPYQYLKEQASADIKRLLEAKARGWK